MSRLTDWLDDRTGYRKAGKWLFGWQLAGGAKWRYIWGKLLVYVFVVQLLTGLFLLTAYSPSSTTAWESVYYIEHQMTLGSVIRGVHHYSSHAMVILLGIHILQVVMYRAYTAPREINFWLGMLLMLVTLGMALTGYYLPWDQRGYYAVRVMTGIAGITPAIGPETVTLIKGGSEFGHHTITRLFTAHAFLLPALFVFLTVLHIALFRRQGPKPPDDAAPNPQPYWPHQAIRDYFACAVLLAIIVTVAVVSSVELAPPADPSEPYEIARPELYFVFLFRLLKFEAISTFVGGMIIPGILMTVLVLMPIIGRKAAGHRFNLGFLLFVGAAITGLTALSLWEDSSDPKFQAGTEDAAKSNARLKELIDGNGIPPGGAINILRDDPKTAGPRLYKKNCAVCHPYNGHDGTGEKLTTLKDGKLVEVPGTAADLGNFTQREWLKQTVIDYHRKHVEPLSRTAWHKKWSDDAEGWDGGMKDWFDENKGVLNDPANANQVDALIEYLDSLSGKTGLDPAKVELGQSVFESGDEDGTFNKGKFGDYGTCAACHSVERGNTDNTGPNLFGYRSRDWMKKFIADPAHDTHYGGNNHMPLFKTQLNAREIDILIKWMHREWYEPPKK